VHPWESSFSGHSSDVERTQAEGRTCAFMSGSKHSINFSQMMEERQILLSLQETDLEVPEAKLAEEQACVLHSFDGWDLLAELEELHACMAMVVDEHAINAGELLQLVLEISNVLVNLGMLPIQHIPQLPKMAQEVMVAASLILECLREEHASGAGP
jgi:hypothetical protein